MVTNNNIDNSNCIVHERNNTEWKIKKSSVFPLYNIMDKMKYFAKTGVVENMRDQSYLMYTYDLI